MILTKPKIFVSSTVYDLPSERKAAFEAIKEVGGIAVMSEYTIEASSADSLTTCLDKVKYCDIYILILGGKYGWQPNQKESITELEYKTAYENNLSILVFNTTYPKEELQKEFEKKVEEKHFRKLTTDAFQLKDEIKKSLEEELAKNQNQFFNSTEIIYSNLASITFPEYLYHAKLNIDKKEIKEQLKAKKEKIKFKPSIFDYAIAKLRLANVRFPRDWIIWGDSLYTFHNLQDLKLPLNHLIDFGTSEKLLCEEFYNQSVDALSNFKYLLKRCLETKLYKKHIKWFKEQKVFAFMPVWKDENENWLPVTVEWTKDKKATRTVVDINYDLKDSKKIFNLKCLAFKTDFYLIEKKWYLSIKPDWIFLWQDLINCDYAYKNIQWLKKKERNMHVFNHLSFILNYLQPQISEPMFQEDIDYKYLIIGNLEKFDFAPLVNDEMWRSLESPINNKNLEDSLKLF